MSCRNSMLSLILYLSANAVQVQLINDAYNLVIDAIVGPEIDLKDVREPYSGILVTLKQVKIPIASVDVPSGIFSLISLTSSQNFIHSSFKKKQPHLQACKVHKNRSTIHL